MNEHISIYGSKRSPSLKMVERLDTILFLPILMMLFDNV